MGVKRFTAVKDNTITNAYKSNLTTRGTGSNMGASDVLDVFSIYGQATTSSSELARSLVEFQTSQITTERSAGRLPASGSVNFYLKMFNAKHVQTVPKDFYLTVQAVSGSWREGQGLDMEEYKDVDKSNWISSSLSTSWTSEGGDFYSTPLYTQHFGNGTEDLELDITGLVEGWINGTIVNHGLVVKLSGSNEAETKSYFIKKFFGRTSEYELLRPVVEARWNSAVTDDRGNFYYSSSLAPAADNLNTLYLYNYIRGRLKNIPGPNSGSIFVSLYSGSTAPSGSALTLWNGSTVATGSFDSVGTYTVNLAITASSTPLTKIFDVWFSGSEVYYTGSIIPKTFDASMPYPIDRYVTKITNLKPAYIKSEEPKLRVFIRPKNWNPTVYTKAVASPTPTTIHDAFYRVVRVADNFEVIPYGTGSLLHTKLSYDVSGNYFPLDMSLFEEDYMYMLKFAYNVGNGYEEQPESFKFRVDKNDKFNI